MTNPGGLEGANLRLIDAIPTPGDSCQPNPHSRYSRCRATGQAGWEEVAEDMALWPGMAENLAEGYEGVPNFDGRREGVDRFTTETEHEVGGCLLRRALGMCSLYVAEGEPDE